MPDAKCVSGKIIKKIIINAKILMPHDATIVVDKSIGVVVAKCIHKIVAFHTELVCAANL